MKKQVLINAWLLAYVLLAVAALTPGSQIVPQPQNQPQPKATVPPLTYWSFASPASSLSPAADIETVWGVVLDAAVEAGKIVVNIQEDDSNASHLYSFALYAACSGVPVASTTPHTFINTGVAVEIPFQTTVTLPPGLYCIGMTGNASALQVGAAPQTWTPYYAANAGSTSGGVSLPNLPAQTLAWGVRPALSFTLETAGTTVAPSHYVSLTWTTSTTSGVTGHNVYRSTTKGGPYTKLTTTAVTGTTYTDNSVTAGTTYYYVTTAVGNGESGYSNEASATVPTP